MYKEFTANDIKKYFNLPLDYKIDGHISFGTWDDVKSFQIFKRNLKDMNIVFSSKTLPGFFSRILEVDIKNKRYWFSVNYGGTLLSEYLHIGCLFGSKKNIHIGSFGGLCPEMAPLDLLLPTYSFSKETSASLYNRKAKDFRHFPDKKLFKIIKTKIPTEYKVWEGPIISNQAMMGETWEDVKSWSKAGYYGVEMETATMFAVSSHFKVPSASVLYNSDNLVKGQTVGDKSHRQQKAERERIRNEVYKIAIKTLLDK